MPRSATPPPTRRTVADLLAALGDIPPDRVRLVPTPGTATERDVLAVHDREGRLCELIDGILVEKAMGFEESRLAFILITFLGDFLSTHNLGVAAGPDGILRLTSGLVRIPDLCFVSWDRLPGRKLPRSPVPRLPIDLAVEIVSKGNTKAEMERKLGEYFDAGVRLVWIIEPRRRTIRVHNAPDRPTLLRDGDTLDGGNVLPGFILAVSTLFDQASRGPDA